MQDSIINAHRLIGETIHDPGEDRRGRIVGVDQSRSVPVIFVIWQEQTGIQRFELTRDELRQLTEACSRSCSVGHDPQAKGSDGTQAGFDDEASFWPAFVQRRVGFR